MKHNEETPDIKKDYEAFIQYAKENKLGPFAKEIQHSEQLVEWSKANNIELTNTSGFTRNQFMFTMFLLSNKNELTKMGDLKSVFELVYNFLKSNR